ncbi:hypothetical protein [Streptomyces millisiae]|uniref:Uncharacterized protein n=1 Tax=Streptomyces millisiae TaxID=3075542 RepID=A0ABU2LHN7_9ACTN|nr:hypothetical protein [Streptomyces sp. DSM 44918]MDT0317093.1 hypothetical protein [Streptomyces sp. DSM 44918]
MESVVDQDARRRTVVITGVGFRTSEVGADSGNVFTASHIKPNIGAPARWRSRGRGSR